MLFRSLFSQLPQAAAAGAGGVTVALTWIGGGGAILISTPVLVTTGVVAGVAVGGYYAWQYYKNREQRKVEYWANKYGLTYEQLSDFLHDWKHENGRGPKDNLTKAEWAIVAYEAARWYGTR